MPYLIDGHNLIPHVPGLSLDGVDDELDLMRILVPYFQRIRKKAILFFDRAFPGGEKQIRRGNLMVRFVRAPRIADQAILSELARLGGEAANYTVVTSDQHLRESAMRHGARVISSAEFSRMLFKQKGNEEHHEDEHGDLDYWLRQFKDRPDGF